MRKCRYQKGSVKKQRGRWERFLDEIGNWAGDIRKAKVPDQFLVDYVRVYDLVEKQ